MNITVGPEPQLHEVEEAASLIMEAAHEDCNIIFGAVVDPNMGEALRITVIATGFDQHEPEEEVLGNAIAAHAHRVRRQSQQMPMPGMAPAPTRVQVQVPASSTLTRKPKREPAPRPSLNPMFNSVAQPAVAPQPPAPPVPAAQESGGYPQAPQVRPAGNSGGWSRGDLNAADPREVPAFLRRRGEPDGGYVR